VSALRPPAQLLAFAVVLGACRNQANLALHLPAHERLGPPAHQVCAGRAARRDEGGIAGLVTRLRGAVVSVTAGRSAGGERERSLGSGIVIAPDGLVLTSRHVIAGADDVHAELDDGRTFAGAVVARDAWLDVALVRLDGARGLPIAELGSSEALAVGDPVIAIGNPFGLGPSVTRGILSAKARAVEDGPGGLFLQSDAAVNPGDSGGPLVDGDGRVIGVNTAIIEHGHGISFAVPIDDVSAVLGELIKTGHVVRGHVGISYQAIDAPLSRALAGGPGPGPAPGAAIITELDRGGPGARAGLRAGDVIASLDGHDVPRAVDLTHELGSRKPGGLVRLGIVRDGRSSTVSVLLDAEPIHDEDDLSRARPRAPASSPLGLRAVDDAGGGARVEEVDPESVVADDLRPGDVVVELNRSPVKSAADLRHLLGAAPRPSTALLRVRRRGSFLYVGIDVR
jgi:serine protease Do